MSVVRCRRSWTRGSPENREGCHKTETILLLPAALLSSGGPLWGGGVPLLPFEPTGRDSEPKPGVLTHETAPPEVDWTQVEETIGEIIDKLTSLPQGSLEVLAPAVPQESPLSQIGLTTLDEPPGSLTGQEMVKRKLDSISCQTHSDFEESSRPDKSSAKRLCARDSSDQAGRSWADFVKSDGVGSATDEKSKGLTYQRMEPIRSEPSEPTTSRAEGVSSVYLETVDDLGFTEPCPTPPIFKRFNTPPSDEDMLRHGVPLLLGFGLDRKVVAKLTGVHRSIADFFASKSVVDIRELQRNHRGGAKALAWEGDGGLALTRVLHWILRTWGSSHERTEIRGLLNYNIEEHLRLIVVDTETDLTRPTGSSGGRDSLPFRLEAGGKAIDLSNIPWRVNTCRDYTRLTLIAVEGKSALFLTIITRELPENGSLRGCQNELYSEIRAAHPLLLPSVSKILPRGFKFSSLSAATPFWDRKGIFDEIFQPQSRQTGLKPQILPFYVTVHPEGKLTATFNVNSARTLRVQSAGPIASWKKMDFVDVDELNVDEPKYKMLRDNCRIEYNRRDDRPLRPQFNGRLIVDSNVTGTPLKASIKFEDARCPTRFVKRIRELECPVTVYEPKSGPWVIGFRQPKPMLKTVKLADSQKELLRVPSDWQTQTSPSIHSIPLKTPKDRAMRFKAKAMEMFLPKLTGLPFAEILRTLKNGELREIAAIHWPFDLNGHADFAPFNPVSKVESIADFESFLALDEALEKLHELWSESQPPMTWNTQIYSFIDFHCKRSLSLSLGNNGSAVINFGGRQLATYLLPIATRFRKGCLHGILAFKGRDFTLLLHLKSAPLSDCSDEYYWAASEAFWSRLPGNKEKSPWQDAPIGLSILNHNGLYALRGDGWQEQTIRDVTDPSIYEEDFSSLDSTSDSVM